jgi:hypothetical protein
VVKERGKLNIQPLFHRSSVHHQRQSTSEGTGDDRDHHNGSGSGAGDSNGDNDGDSGSRSPMGGKDEAKENNELSAKWTLRKQAALSIDVLAMSFPPRDILNAALPKIQSCFESENVLVKESGMLALGALSSGCLEEISMYIPQLFPFIIISLKNNLPEMRSISCWVVSRFCRLFVDRTI